MDFSAKRVAEQIEKQKQLLMGNHADRLASILRAGNCTKIIGGCREFRDRLYTPLKTIITFIKQVLDTDKSCKKAVAGVTVEHLASEKKVSAQIQDHIAKHDNDYLKKQ